jgi:hypothetical protein
MMKEKNRTMVASGRDNRKIKNEEIIEAKNKYKAYLTNYAKQNRAAKNRDTLAKVRTSHEVAPKFATDNIFKSF